MRRALAPILAATAIVTLAGCHVAKPASQTFGVAALDVSGTPEAAIESIATQAQQDGYVVSRDGSRAVFVDFGVTAARVPVPTRYGIWGSRVSFRDTKVASSAYYEAFTAPNGTRLRMQNNPVYWHPDIGTWLPGPYDVDTAAGLMRGATGAPAVVTDAPVVELERVEIERSVEQVEQVEEIEEVVIELEDVTEEALPAVPQAPRAPERLPTPPHLQK